MEESAEAACDATPAEVLSPHSIKRAHAADAVASLKRLCSPDAPLVVDEADAITMSELENQHQMQELQASIAYLLQKEKAHAAALAAQKSAAEARAALRARYGVERVPLLGLQHLPKDIVVVITRFLSRMDQLALSGVCHHLYIAVRDGVTLDTVRVRLHVSNASLIANLSFPGRMMQSWALTKELIVYIDHRLLESPSMRYVNRAFYNILATFGCYTTLRVWPETPMEWPKKWFLPPYFMNAHHGVRVLDSPFSPQWIVPHYQDNSRVSNSSRPLVLPTVGIYASNQRSLRLFSVSPANDAIRRTYYPLSTELFLLDLSIRHMCGCVQSFTSLKRLVISCTTINLTLLADQIRAFKSCCTNLARIQLIEPSRTEYQVYGIGVYYINFSALTSVCNALKRECPRVCVAIPLAPLVDDTADRTPRISTSYVMPVSAYQNLEWSIGSKWMAEVLQWRHIDDVSGNYSGTVGPTTLQYRIWKLVFAFELTARGMPLLLDESNGEYNLIDMPHSQYRQFLEHARHILNHNQFQSITQSVFTPAVYDAAVNVVKAAWVIIDPEMKQ